MTNPIPPGEATILLVTLFHMKVTVRFHFETALRSHQIRMLSRMKQVLLALKNWIHRPVSVADSLFNAIEGRDFIRMKELPSP
ncbi:MAG: hypothetical protein Ct9H300mP19_13270 [Dehalococcoidia bacterium]|nr:MAG: hypothetical protein Ct9H300mP19_13270 [Dehalococcoidia bacterium]